MSGDGGEWSDYEKQILKALAEGGGTMHVLKPMRDIVGAGNGRLLKQFYEFSQLIGLKILPGGLVFGLTHGLAEPYRDLFLQPEDLEAREG